MEKKFYLTLRERKIMILMLKEADERAGLWPNNTLKSNDELKNLLLFLSDYVAAYIQGNITLSDLERCGE